MIALLVAALWLQAADPVAEPPRFTTEQDGGHALLNEEVGRIAGRVEIVRGEPFDRAPLAVRVPGELRRAAAEIRAFNVLTRERLAARGRAWQDVGLGSADGPRELFLALAADLERIVLDPQEGRLLLGTDVLSPGDFEPTAQEDDPATILLLTGMRPDAPLVAHALAHLRRVQREGRDTLEETTDRLLAAAAWAEGEANLVAVRYLFAGLQVTDDVMQFVRRPDEVLDGALLPPRLEQLDETARELISFVYFDGFARAVERHRSGGWPALDEAMRTRTTTRDLLHPELEPLAPPGFGPPSPPAEGLLLADEDSLGQQAITVLVARMTGKDSLGLVAGEGWAGDRLYRWETGGASDAGFTEWVTRWVGDGDAGGRGAEEIAGDFAYAYARAVETRLPGRRFAEVGPGEQALVAGDRVIRIEQQGSRVRVLIRPL